MTSNYNLCSFSGTRVKKTGFLNPVFEHCNFDLKNTSGIDLGCSGFWDCSFQGKLEDVRLHGKYPYALQQEKNTPPVMTGLHNVDFSEAKLTFISLRDGCIVEEVKLPSIGTSFLYSRNTMIKSAKKISNHLSDQQRCAFLTVCKVSALHASAQDITFLCEGDLLALCDATSAHALFEALKQRFRLAGPYVISKP
jgi:hypothetical protein